jgi:hypothetical protein
MDSMRHDIRAELDELPSEDIKVSAAATNQRSPARQELC